MNWSEFMKALFPPKVLKSEYDIKVAELGKIETENFALVTAIASKQDTIDELQITITDLMAQLDAKHIVDIRHESLETYKAYLDTIPDTPREYDFGHGTKRVHNIFRSSIQDEEDIRDFITNMLEFDGSQYETADSLVYNFGKRMSSKYRTTRYYDTDINLYGFIEYWATAKETIQRIKNGDDKLFDCDDMMTLKFSCLYYLLKDYFPTDRWRLRGFIADLWGSGGHALLGWVKEGPNDFVPIETTYLDIDQNIIWNSNYTIGSQLFYQIRYSFDESTEYVKI